MNALKLVFVSLVGAGLALGCDQKPEGGAAGASSSAKPTVASATASVSASASASTVASAAPSASAAPKHKRARFGLAGMYFHAAKKLTDLDEAQKTKLAEIEKGFEDPAPPAEMKAYHDELVTQVKAGKIETAKLDPLKAAAEKAMITHRDKELDALNGLHALLKAPQRTALVAALKAKEGKGPMMGPKGGPGGKMGHDPKEKVAHMTKELGLDDAQAKKVEAILPKEDAKAHDPEAWKKKMEAVNTAFEKEGFDAKKQELFTGKGPGAAHGGMDSAFLDKLLPILKPEQREKLAANMAMGPGGKHHKGMGGHPHPAASGSASGAPSAAPSGKPGDDDDDD